MQVRRKPNAKRKAAGDDKRHRILIIDDNAFDLRAIQIQVRISHVMALFVFGMWLVRLFAARMHACTCTHALVPPPPHYHRTTPAARHTNHCREGLYLSDCFAWSGGLAFA